MSEARVDGLEADIHDIKGTLARLEPMIIRIDATLPSLANKAELADLRTELLTTLADKPGRGYLWGVMGMMVASYTAALAAAALLASIILPRLPPAPVPPLAPSGPHVNAASISGDAVTQAGLIFWLTATPRRRRNRRMRRRVSQFDPSEIPPVSVAAEDASMREARRRLAERVAAKEAAAKQELARQLHGDGDFDQRLAAAGAAVAPSEPVAYRFEARQGGFAITAITEEDLAVPVSPRTTLKWPKV